ncbi:MAG: hypothetical protein G8345_16250, partial [Magnetococcales bacterium]|nr:hypothetical protein [Magnetococcales bacterium]
MPITPGTSNGSPFELNLYGQDIKLDVASTNSTEDWFSIVVDETLNVGISLTGLDASTTVELIRGTTTIGTPVTNSSAAFFGQFPVSAGTYFVHVTSANASHGYQLSLTGLPTASSVNTGNNTSANATDLGNLNALGEYYVMDWVGSSDSVDFYRFALTAPTSNFSLILSNLTADASVQLLRGSTSINIGADVADAGDQVYAATGLSAGTYTVAVMRDGSAQTNYSLQLQAIAGALDVGNTDGTAQSLDVADGPVEFQQALTTTDAGDMYSFVVDTASNVTALLSGLAANADIRLLSGAGATLATAASTGRDTESLTYGGLAVGTYFIQVYGSSVTTNYNLQVLTSSDNRSDNTTGTATSLGSVGANQAITGYVSSSGDASDYYSFVVDSSGTWVNLQLEGAPGSLNFTLTGGDLANPLVGEGDGSGATPISVQLNAGTYFVQVGAATDSSSVYSLC